MVRRELDDYLHNFGCSLGRAANPMEKSLVICLGIPNGSNSVLSNMDDSGNLLVTVDR
jgi:hypothetical protein